MGVISRVNSNEITALKKSDNAVSISDMHIIQLGEHFYKIRTCEVIFIGAGFDVLKEAQQVC